MESDNLSPFFNHSQTEYGRFTFLKGHKSIKEFNSYVGPSYTILDQIIKLALTPNNYREVLDGLNNTAELNKVGA
jgi:hypothetical protein